MIAASTVTATAATSTSPSTSTTLTTTMLRMTTQYDWLVPTSAALVIALLQKRLATTATATTTELAVASQQKTNCNTWNSNRNNNINPVCRSLVDRTRRRKRQPQDPPPPWELPSSSFLTTITTLKGGGGGQRGNSIVPTTNKSTTTTSRNTKRHHQRTVRGNTATTNTTLYQTWMREVPQVVRFGVAGNLGNVGFFYLDKVIYHILSSYLRRSGAGVEPHHHPSPPGPAGAAGAAASSVVTGLLLQYQESVSFFTAYVLQIVSTHVLYAVLVYGVSTIDTYDKYTTTLCGQFKIYGIGLIGATYCQAYIKQCGYPKHVAFWGTTAIFAVFNYFLITWSVQTAISSATTTKNPSSRSPHNKNKQPRPQSSNTLLPSELK